LKAWLLALLVGGWLWGTPPEKKPEYVEAFSAFSQQKYALARDLTEKILRKEPDNYAALFLLGLIYHYGEGSIPRAYYCYSKARDRMERAYNHPDRSSSQQIYGDLLVEMGEAAQQLERYQEALEIIDFHDKLYPTDRRAVRKGWPLMKLGRLEEARKLMTQLAEDPAFSSYRGNALNTLGNIEFETDNMEKSYEYFSRILKEVQGELGVDPVYWSNAGEAARDLLRYDECEKLMLESTKHFNPYTYSDPWGFLAELYAAENRMPEALEALKSMQAWRISGSAQVSQNKWAECYAHAGSVLLQMGYDEKALSILERLVRRQDRNSSISTPASLVEARLVFLYVLALQRNTQRIREKLSYCSWREFPRVATGLWRMQRQIARDQQRVANLVVSNTGLEGFIQPYGARSLDQPYFSPASWSFFGPGATIAAVERSLRSDKPEMKARSPYLLAILGEALLHDGNTREAQKQLEEALAQLPTAEVKLRLRCQAVLARALSQQGRNSEALHYLQSLMDSDPSQLRAVGLALPLQIESDGSALANLARGWLYRSPRCQKARAAFVLKLRAESGELRGELFGPDGTLSGRFNGQPRPHMADAARNFCQIFHEQAFAPVIDLSQTDIRSIDGSTGATRADALKDLVD